MQVETFCASTGGSGYKSLVKAALLGSEGGGSPVRSEGRKGRVFGVGTVCHSLTNGDTLGTTPL